MKQQKEVALRELRRPVAGLMRWGVLLGGVGALGALIPFIGMIELGKVLLRPGPPQAGALIMVAVVIVVSLSVSWMCTGLALWLTHIADHRLQGLLRRMLVKKLGEVPLGWYSDKTSGAVRKTVQDDFDDLHYLTAHHDVELVSAIVMPLGGLAYLIWLDWRLALLAVVTLPIYLVAYVWMMHGFSEKMVQLDAIFTRVSAAIVEFVHGITVVKVFGQTGRAHHRFQQAVRQYSELYSGWVRPLLRLEAFSSMALSVPVIILVSLAGGTWLIQGGNLSPIDLLAEVLIAVVIPQTLITLSQGLTAQRKAVAAAGRIVDLLDVPSLPLPGQPQLPDGSEIAFEQVSFNYDDGRAVLSGINLRCQPGKVTALVGHSGAGKSTLAKLVPRFYDVTAGAVRVGSVDVRQIEPDVLYRQVGFVFQDAQLVHGSIADNLRLGRPSATEEEMIEAARAAQIHERILAAPKGYAAVIGEDVVFSGGEAQRLSIARMLLADTPILIMDEATAHADPECEVQIQDALSAVARGRTVLVIAHRLTTITGVDQIIVLKDGEIVESGTHTELLALDGCYARMWRFFADTGSDECSMEKGASA